MTLTEKGTAVLERLERAGYEAYFVGGCVRDRLLGKDIHDVDLTTSAAPEEMRAVFDGLPVLDTGLRHGTLTVLVDHTPVEVTTYRTESGYSDGRHPDTVRFTRSLREDLQRRDFTVNAMAFHPRTGLIDPFGGQRDLEQKCLRAVGDPDARFTEDALRILRALRFASTLGFLIEDETANAMRRQKDRMTLLSAERIANELRRLVCGVNAGAVLCNGWDVLAVVLPFLAPMHGFDQHNEHHIFDVLTHTAAAMDAIAPAVRLRLAALFHDSGKPETFFLDADGVGHFYGHATVSARIAQEALTALRFDKATAAQVTRLVKLHDAPIEESRPAVRRKLNQLGADGLFDLIALQRADTLALAPQYRKRTAHFDTLTRIAKELLAENACFSVRDLAVNGNDLTALGFRGAAVGSTLRELVRAVMDERVPNEQAALLALAAALK
ncbi:MAG: HD domain-containing protein [Clostridia bacterium]|nr:HD domain-containing protein [Clostridia bacterium]